jgi:hypothetical protein
MQTDQQSRLAALARRQVLRRLVERAADRWADLMKRQNIKAE